MSHLPFLILHGLKVWLALAALAVIAGAALAIARPRRRARAGWRRELESLGPCSPERNWTSGQEVTLSGELVGPGTVSSRRTPSGDITDEECPEELELRTAEGTSLRIRAPLSLRCGSIVTGVADGVRHSLAAGERVRLHGRIDKVAGEDEAAFRESAHRWELAAPASAVAIAAVAEGRPAVRVRRRRAAIGGLVGLLLHAGGSTAVSGIAYGQIEEHLTIIRGLPWEYHEELEVRPSASLAAASPLFRRRTLSRLGNELFVHDSTGRAAVEASVTSYELAGECELACMAAFGRGAPELALASAGCARMPQRAHYRATALYYLGRFGEASDAFEQVTAPSLDPELDIDVLVEAAEVHLLAGQPGRAQRALAAFSRRVEPAGGEEARKAAVLADALAARGGDSAARQRLRLVGGETAGFAAPLLADVESGEARLQQLPRMEQLDRTTLSPSGWHEAVSAFLEYEATGRVSNESKEGRKLRCPEARTYPTRDFLVDGSALDRRTSMLEGLALAVTDQARRRAPPSDEPTRDAVGCAELILAEYLAGVGRLDDASELLDRASQLVSPKTREQERALALQAGLAYRRGDRDRASALAEQLIELGQDPAGSTLVRALRFAQDPRVISPSGEPSPARVASALRGDGRGLLPAMMDHSSSVPMWLFVLGPWLEQGRERLLDLALHRRTYLVDTARGFASAQLQLATVMRSAPLAARWREVVDRHLAAELRRDTALVLDVLRLMFDGQLARDWNDGF
jgi:tetratricopeptide (TPR) repeat protein